KLVTWADGDPRQELDGGALPMPTVVWQRDGLRLRVTAFGAGPPGAGTLFLRYRVENQGGSREQVRLFLAVRPFQVLPPWQALNVQGGVAQIRELRFDGRAVWVVRARAIGPVTPPTDFGAATFEDGAITEFIAPGVLPDAREVVGPFRFRAGARAPV